MAADRQSGGTSMAYRQAFARSLQSRLTGLESTSTLPVFEDEAATVIRHTNVSDPVPPWPGYTGSSSDSEPYFDFDLDTDSPGSPIEDPSELVLLPAGPSSIEPESGCVSSRFGTSPDSDGSDYFEVGSYSESPPKDITSCSSKPLSCSPCFPVRGFRRSPSPPFTTPDSTPNTTPNATPSDGSGSFVSCNGLSPHQKPEASLSNGHTSFLTDIDYLPLEENQESPSSPDIEYDERLPPISALSLGILSRDSEEEHSSYLPDEERISTNISVSEIGEDREETDEELKGRENEEDKNTEEIEPVNGEEEHTKEEINGVEDGEISNCSSNLDSDSTLDSENHVVDDTSDSLLFEEKTPSRTVFSRPSSLAVEHPNKTCRFPLAGVSPLLDSDTDDSPSESPSQPLPKLLINFEDNLESCQENECTGSGDEETPRQRTRRCSSLRTGRTPPGTPGRKKIVRFADTLGLDLANVKEFVEGIPKVPNSAYDDLPDADIEPELEGSPPRTEEIIDISCPPPLPPQSGLKTLVPLFQQPGGRPDFIQKVRKNNVSLENAILQDPSMLSISGMVRVRNLDFNKSVHIRYSTDGWASFSDLQATYVPHSCDGFSDKFTFVLFAHTLGVGQRLEFAVRFQCKGSQYWDSNDGANYAFQCLPASSSAPYLSLSSPEERWTSFY